MTYDELIVGLEPVVDALDAQNDLLSQIHDLLEHVSEVQYGVILGLGILAGILLIYILLRRF